MMESVKPPDRKCVAENKDTRMNCLQSGTSVETHNMLLNIDDVD